jgi:tetratricopeptide (TPR) repeat protein
LALNKRKVLETARKHAQKGAKAKALKEYNKLLKADPRDAKLLLEVGDAYRRWGQAEEAIAQYGKVAQQYRQDGFDARAVAVFKQILNLDPKHYAAYVSLSELYQRMGLDSEAIAALQTAADGYHKEGRKGEALDLLRQTAALDPTNTTSRLKVADLLRQEGMESEAVSEYRAVVEELDSQGNREQVLVVLERILEVNADDLDTLNSLTKNLMASGELDRAEVFAIRMLNASTEPSQYELLMELYSQGGNDEKLAEATRGLAKLHRDRGDEETARTLMQRLPVEEVGSSSRMAVDVSEVAEPDLEDDELLEEEPFLTLDDEASPSAAPLAADEDDAIDLETEAPQPGDLVDPTPLPEGDPDQLLAEANVYLRYGKRDQAIASLRGVLAQDPVHRAALEKLGEAYAADDQKGPAVEVWTQAATQAREAGDAETFVGLKNQTDRKFKFY